MATYYWVGASGNNFFTPNSWSLSSGGAPVLATPTSSDNVVFDRVATYTVVCDPYTFNSPQCANFSVTAGTVTFSLSAGQSGNAFVTAYGNISCVAATVFSAAANEYGVIGHSAQSGAATVVFNGCNTAKVQFSGGSSNSLTSYTFCNGGTQTFHGVSIYFSTSSPFVCAGSTITVDNSIRNAGGQVDSFSIYGASTLSVAGTTINFGSATATTYPISSDFFLSSYPGGTTEPNLTTFNITHVRTYNSTLYRFFWYDSSNVLHAFKVGNLTLKGVTDKNTSSATIQGVYGTNALTATDISATIQQDYFDSKTYIASGAVTLNGSNLSYLGTSSSGHTFSSTVTLTTGTGGTYSSQLSPNAYPSLAVTFTGAVSMTGALNDGAKLSLPNNTVVTFSSTITSTAPANSTDFNRIFNVASSMSVTCAGAVSLTNTDVYMPYTDWTQTGTTTFTTTTNPTSLAAYVEVFSLKMGTGAASFTSTSLAIDGVSATNYALQSGGPVTVNGSGVSTGVSCLFNGYYGGKLVAFVASTLVTWTDVTIADTSGGSLSEWTVTGAGGFTLAGGTKSSFVIMEGAKWAVAGPTSLTTGPSPLYTPYGEIVNRINYVASGGGTFSVTGITNDYNAYFFTGTISASTFTGAFTSTNTSLTFGGAGATFSSTCTHTSPGYASSQLTFSNTTAMTFNGAASFSNLVGFVGFSTTTTINNAFSMSATTLLDANSSSSCVLTGTLVTTSTTTAFTLTNVRMSIPANTVISNNVVLADNGGLYWTGDLTINGTLTSSGASKFNVLSTYSDFSGGSLTVNNTTTLVNCNVTVRTVTVSPGANKSFSYSLSTPIANNNASRNGTPFGNSTNQVTYPEIVCDTLTITVSGTGTCTIAGGGSANYRTFVRPFSAAELQLTLNMAAVTLTDVDFFRVTPLGTLARPWTGTRLGNVGTLTGITTATPKNCYWVGGSGSWDGAKWATTTGGTGAIANYPLPQDTAVFDANSGTGNFTYPASVRVGTLVTNSPNAGNIYCNDANIVTSGAPALMWVSGDILAGGSTTAFTVGNDSTGTYDSFSSTYGYLQGILLVDNSTSATHTIAASANKFLPYSSLLLGVAGTVYVTESMTQPVFSIAEYSPLSTYTSQFFVTAPQIGSSTFDYASAGAVSPSTLPGRGYFTFNQNGAATSFGAALIYNNNVTIPTYTTTTAYTCYASHTITSYSANAGNLVFTDVTAGGLYSRTWQLNTLAFSTSALSVTVNTNNNGGTQDFLYFFPSGNGRTLSVGSFAVNYAGSGLKQITLATYINTGFTLSKLYGGKVALTGANISTTTGSYRPVNASPSATWYTTGTIGAGATGWNSGTPSTGNSGFFMF